MIPAIKEAIKQNEIGNGSPYALDFARLGQSGASFGIFQGDTNVSSEAQNTLISILQNDGVDQVSISRITSQLFQPCPNGNPLDAIDTQTVTNAFNSVQGKSAIDAMDGQLLQVVLTELQSSLDAATQVHMSIDPTAQLYISLWVNMTGQPTSLNQWIRGINIGNGVASPTPPIVTQNNLIAYLQASKFFVLHPRNFVHMQDSVNAAQALLPTN